MTLTYVEWGQGQHSLNYMTFTFLWVYYILTMSYDDLLASQEDKDGQIETQINS